ncbi:hypothetical protein [Nocardia flavorosea]|uniref:hypothetical protein n=1 Tax=Nocardia flavorosea TaxID=53429 RepID=UPI0024572043|nr:hypothetical protein [Nocardia flavorosea]
MNTHMSRFEPRNSEGASDGDPQRPRIFADALLRFPAKRPTAGYRTWIGGLSCAVIRDQGFGMLHEDIYSSDEARPTMVRAPLAGRLPNAVQLLAVFQGVRFEDHEFFRSAHCLVLLHNCRMYADSAERMAELDQRCRELVGEIEDWSTRNLSNGRHRTVVETAVEPESLGQIIDRLAEAWARANHDVAHAQNDKGVALLHWRRLAELVGEYNDLVPGSRTSRPAVSGQVDAIVSAPGTTSPTTCS